MQNWALTFFLLLLFFSFVSLLFLSSHFFSLFSFVFSAKGTNGRMGKIGEKLGQGDRETRKAGKGGMGEDRNSNIRDVEEKTIEEHVCVCELGTVHALRWINFDSYCKKSAIYFPFP